MARVAERESLTPETVRDEVAGGRLVIPANTVHLEGRLDPMAIGSVASVKINANIGSSPTTSNMDEEVAKLELAVQWGADTVMDLSTGRMIDETRGAILAASTVPIGTVPIYQAIADIRLEDLTAVDLLDMIEHQARQGVDYMTVHCGVLLEHLALVATTISWTSPRRGTSPSVSGMACGREAWRTRRMQRNSPSWRRSASSPCAPGSAACRS
jgi:phosphomethylpyrimidine synthase